MRFKVPSACLAAAAFALGTAPAHAATQPLQPLTPPAPSITTPLVRPAVPDAVLSSPLHALAASSIRAHAASARYTTADGISIPVDVSSGYTATPAAIQSYVNYLGSLMHGPELRNLHVFIATPRQIESTFCGSGALACYEGDNETMYVPGAAQQSNPPLQFLIAHEYGHHIEINRSNAPWVAFDTGVKNWFTYEQVCTRVRERKLATSYWSDPSEGFAESYADSQYPGVPFPFNRLMLPDQGAYLAIRQDVLQPWTGPHTVPLSGTLGSGAPSTQSFQLPTPLDGSVSFTLSPPARASYRLRVMSGSKTIASGGRGTTSIRALCGVRTLTLQVTRAAGSGPFTLSASIP